MISRVTVKLYRQLYISSVARHIDQLIKYKIKKSTSICTVPLYGKSDI